MERAGGDLPSYLRRSSALQVHGAARHPTAAAADRASLQGISRKTGLEVWLLASMNAIYDLTASGKTDARACTSIVAQSSDGVLTVGRNLDYPLYAAPPYPDPRPAVGSHSRHP